MHELPKELTKSLRSWRGSVVRDSADLETGYYSDEHTDDERQSQNGRRQQPFHNAGRQYAAVPPLQPTHMPQSSRHVSDDKVHRKHWGHSPSSPAQAASPARNEPDTNLIDSRITERHANGSPLQTRRAATFDKQTIQSNKQSLFDQARVHDLDGAASRLEEDPSPLTPDEFYELIGMKRVGEASSPRFNVVPNGMYAKIKTAYDRISVRYHMFNVITYFFMTLQLLLSAVFIILGSLGNVDSHLAVAVLGAVSTVIAGALALMKGQGLPNRLRQGRDSFGMVLFEAQELWWDVGAGRTILYKDIRKLREDYLRVLDDQRRNHPDTWNPSTNKIARGIVASGGRKAGWASKLTLPLTR